MQAKKRIVKDYDNLPEDVKNRLKLEYPRGFVKHLIKYMNKDGLQVSALPYETEDIYYLVRMSATEARQIILDDDDYEDGVLRDNFEDEVFNDDKETKNEVPLEDEDEGSYDEPYEEDNYDEGDDE